MSLKHYQCGIESRTIPDKKKDSVKVGYCMWVFPLKYADDGLCHNCFQKKEALRHGFE